MEVVALSRAYVARNVEPPFEETTVGDVLRERAAAVPEKAAVYYLDGELRSLSYADLLADATALAARLLAVARPGDLVGSWTGNDVEWVVLQYACALGGMAIVPFNPVLTDHELGEGMSQAGVRVLFTVEDFRGVNLLERARSLCAGRDVVVADLRNWRELPDGPGELPPVRPADPYLVQFTSGTTGRPKGAVLSHRTAYNNARQRALLLQPGPNEVWCSPAPFYHVGGSVSQVLGALAASGAVVVVAPPRASVVLDLMERTRATHVGLIGKLALDILDDPTLPTRDLSSLTSLALGGTGVLPHVVERFRDLLGVSVVNGYGQSESPHICGTRPEDSDEDRLSTIGRPLPHRDLCIRSLGSSDVADLGETGEIWTRGPLVMDGYLNDPQATASVIDDDGWLCTGDLGSMDERGMVTFRGRSRELIIRGGENIYPQEIENVLSEVPGVAAVAVLGTPHPRWGEEVTAVVLTSPDAAPTVAELRAFASTKLAPFKVPERWTFVAALPYTASGKIMKSVLRRELADLARVEGPDGAARPVAPSEQ